MQWHANAACWSPCISEQTGTDTITSMAYAVIAWKASSCKESDMTRQKQSWFHYVTLQVCFQSILIASFQVRMAHIPWLRADIASKWDSQCLTCSPPKGLRVTCVGGICWHTICKSCTMFPAWYYAWDHKWIRATFKLYWNNKSKIRWFWPLFVCSANILSGRMNRGNLVYFLCCLQDRWRMAGCDGPINRLLVAHV